MQFELDFCSSVVLETAVTKAVTEQILQDNCIPADRSLDLMETVTDAQPSPSLENGSLSEEVD